jgi:6-phosphogluconolactonase (cycloisomerase 2 family)
VPISGSTFSVSLPSGTAYTILATAQPTGPSQNCVPSNNSGTVGGANITGVLVTCTTRTFTVSGTISGLTGTGLVLQTNATPVTITGNSLSVTLTSGTAYHIVAQTQPNSPAQYCVITNGSGTVGGANITNVAVGCRNQGVYAFVADSALSSVSAFSIVSNTGLLNYLSTVPTVAANAIPMGIAAVTLPAGAGTYVYTADFNTADVAQFSFNTSTNTLAYVTAVPAGTAPATPTGPGDTPTAMAIDPTGQFLLVADGQNAISDTATTAPGQLLVYTIDQTTGALTPLSGAGFMTPTDTAPGNFTSALALTVNPADTPYVFATNQFDPPGGVAGFAFNNPPSSGNLTQTAPWQIATGNNPVWVTVDPLDRFVYVSNSSDGSVAGYSLNLTSGVLTALTGSPFTAGFGAGAVTGAIAIDPTGRFMYVSDTQNSQLVALSINPTTGALTAITGSPFTTDSAPFAVTVDPSGHFVYVGNTALGTISMFTADPETGALTAVGGSPLSYGGTGANAITVQ